MSSDHKAQPKVVVTVVQKGVVSIKINDTDPGTRYAPLSKADVQKAVTESQRQKPASK